MEYNDKKIKSIVDQYKKKRERENKIYHETLKHDEEWKTKNNEKSKQYYKDNRETLHKKYLSDNEYIKVRNLYRYYLRCNRVDDFINKHSEKYEYLVNRGYIELKEPCEKEKKPDIKDFFDIIDNN